MICAGVEVLKKVKIPDNPGASAVPVEFIHSMELPDTELAHPRLFPAVVGTEGRLLPLVVQPYQKLLRGVAPVLFSVSV